MSSGDKNNETRIIPTIITVSAEMGKSAIKDSVERQLQKVYGSGTYLSDFYIADSGSVAISIGNTFPKDVSDCRPNKNRVIKYIAVDDIAELSGRKDGSQYHIELPKRSAVDQGLKDGRKRLRDDLDQAMARAAYEKIASTAAVENQLNPIKQILRWTRLHQPSFDEVRKAQDKEGDKTLRYVNTLEELGFIELRNGDLHPKRPLEKYDEGEVGDEEFNKQILGEVIEQGFHRLSRDLNLTILRHLPKFANGYYVAALEANNPDLHLDMSAIRENMIDWYGSTGRFHRFELQDKLDFLVRNDILERENDEQEGETMYFYSKQQVYEQMTAVTSL